jgi:hypothetical protein
MLIALKTFNGHNINDGTNYKTTLLNPHGLPDAAPVFIDQTDADSIDAGTYTVTVQQKVLSIEIRSSANRYALITQLKTWFKRGTQGALVATFSDESVDYQLTCRAVQLVQDPDYPMYFTATLQTGISAWRAVTATTHATWTATGTTETEAISVGGKDETFLSVNLTAVGGPASGYLYQNLYRLPNTWAVTHGLIPWCITVDTATLVTAGKMQADCDDLQIVDLNTGQELKRWIATPNNAATKVWINLNIQRGFEIALGAIVASSGVVDYLQFLTDANHQAAMSLMPSQGILYHGTEWFAYDSLDPTNCRAYVSQRGLFGTTMQAHAVNDLFDYIQYPLAMKYGNASATAPSLVDTTYDDTKPLFNLASSSNTSWVWTSADKFYDPDHPNRTGAWSFIKQSLGDLSEIFYIKQDAASGDPAIGLKVASFQQGAVWKDENVEIRATLFRAPGITSVSMTGDKYRSNANWINAILYATDRAHSAWTTLWSEATPASAATWTAWTHNTVSVSPSKGVVEFWIWGGYPAAADAYAAIEALTCTVVVDSAYVPTGAFLGEKNNYPLVVTLENETTGDLITLNYMMLIGKIFSIDGENRLVQYDGYNAFGAVTLDDEGRSVYLRLQGNVTNTIRITGADLGTLGIDLSWYRRRL